MEAIYGKLQIEIEPKGLWRIDKVYGKRLVKVGVKHPEHDLILYDVPEHDFCEEFVDKMLEAEWFNDHFEFVVGRYGQNSRRPAQLKAKIERLEKILVKWKLKVWDDEKK